LSLFLLETKQTVYSMIYISPALKKLLTVYHFPE